MRPKKKVDRRRAKVRDSEGNMVKVKLDREGNIKKAKYSVGQPTGKRRLDAISKMGELVQDVESRREDISKKKLKRLKKLK